MSDGCGKCPVCGESLEVMICPDCSGVQHKACYDYTKRCATYGCDKKPAQIDDKKDESSIENLPVPTETNAVTVNEPELTLNEQVSVLARLKDVPSYRISAEPTVFDLFLNLLFGGDVVRCSPMGAVKHCYRIAIGVNRLAAARALKTAKARYSHVPKEEKTGYDTLSFDGKEYYLGDEKGTITAKSKELYREAIDDLLLADRPDDALTIACESGEIAIANRIAFVLANQRLEEKTGGAHLPYLKVRDLKNAAKYLALTHREDYKGCPEAEAIIKEHASELRTIWDAIAGHTLMTFDHELEQITLIKNTYREHLGTPNLKHFGNLDDIERDVATRYVDNLVGQNDYDKALEIAKQYKIQEKIDSITRKFKTEESERARLARGIKLLRAVRNDK